MIKHTDIKISSFEISLVKLIGQGVKDIKGYLTMEFGDVTFKMTSIVLNNDTEMGCEGEHDLPYLVSFPNAIPDNFDQETLERLYDEAVE